MINVLFLSDTLGLDGAIDKDRKKENLFVWINLQVKFTTCQFEGIWSLESCYTGIIWARYLARQQSAEK